MGGTNLLDMRVALPTSISSRHRHRGMISGCDECDWVGGGSNHGPGEGHGHGQGQGAGYRCYKWKRRG